MAGRQALRRAVVGASPVGIGCMAVTTLLQIGAVRHLPDPPVGDFHSNKVNSSPEAYSYGGVGPTASSTP